MKIYGSLFFGVRVKLFLSYLLKLFQSKEPYIEHSKIYILR